MKFFERKQGFDSIIAKGVIFAGELKIPQHHVFVLDGELKCGTISTERSSDSNVKTGQLVIGGSVTAEKIDVDHLIVAGGSLFVSGDLIVGGSLSIEGNSIVKAKRIVYSKLRIGIDARVEGQLCPIDIAFSTTANES